MTNTTHVQEPLPTGKTKKHARPAHLPRPYFSRTKTDLFPTIVLRPSRIGEVLGALLHRLI